MRKIMKLIIGIILLIVAIYLATDTGSKLAGGKGHEINIPIGTVKIDFSVKGK